LFRLLRLLITRLNIFPQPWLNYLIDPIVKQLRQENFQLVIQACKRFPGEFADHKLESDYLEPYQRQKRRTHA
ncbi:MAG: hypothetical protein ACK55Z_19640, partial [bacterium]